MASSSVHDWLIGVFFYGSVPCRWMLVTSTAARRCVMPVQPAAWTVWNCCWSTEQQLILHCLRSHLFMRLAWEVCVVTVHTTSHRNVFWAMYLSIKMSLLHQSAFVLMQEKSLVELVIFLKKKKRIIESSRRLKFLSVLPKYCWRYILRLWLML